MKRLTHEYKSNENPILYRTYQSQVYIKNQTNKCNKYKDNKQIVPNVTIIIQIDIETERKNELLKLEYPHIIIKTSQLVIDKYNTSI